MNHYRFFEWPARPFMFTDFWAHSSPRQLDDGRWWVRGELFGNSGGLAVDAYFDDLDHPAVQLVGRNLDYMQAESAQALITITAALETVQANLDLSDRERVLACRDLLRQLTEFGRYAKPQASLQLHTALMDYLSDYYRAEDDT